MLFFRVSLRRRFESAVMDIEDSGLEVELVMLPHVLFLVWLSDCSRAVRRLRGRPDKRSECLGPIVEQSCL